MRKATARGGVRFRAGTAGRAAFASGSRCARLPAGKPSRTAHPAICSRPLRLPTRCARLTPFVRCHRSIEEVLARVKDPWHLTRCRRAPSSTRGGAASAVTRALGAVGLEILVQLHDAQPVLLDPLHGAREAVLRLMTVPNHDRRRLAEGILRHDLAPVLRARGLPAR